MAADALSIDVSADQRVTVSGRSGSLKTVLEDVCFRAGVELLYFDADDRPFGGSYREVPLKTFLARLLYRDSFIMQTTDGPDAERVTSLRVLGHPRIGRARRAKGVVRRGHWQPPPGLLKTAFGSARQDSAERDAALAMLASRISGDPVQLQGFLGTDARLMAQAIQRYHGVDTQLRDLKKRYPDPRIVAKIDEILTALTAGTTR